LYADALHKEETRSINNKRYAPAIELECALASAPVDNVHGSSTSTKYVKAHVASYIYEVDSAQQLQHLSRLQMQGCWSEWDGLMNVDFTWNKLIHGTSDGMLKFLVNSTTNTLPTPDNLKRWGVSKVEPSCCICGGLCTLRHILTGCPSALYQGRYTWRHNSILSVLKIAFTEFWHNQLKVNEQTKHLQYINFVRPGAKLSSTCQPRKPLPSSLLSGASDWVFLFDLGENLIFPSQIALTNLRPDGVFYSQQLKAVIMLELTVPIEDRISVSETIKTARYKNLISECQSNGWKAHLITLEVGCRGYIPNDFTRKLKQLDIPKATSTSLRKACSTAALRCSYVIYLNRNNVNWHSRPYIS